MAKEANFPHLPCQNHTSALGVLEIKKADCAISTYSTGIRNLLLRIKRSTVPSGILRHLTSLNSHVTKTFKWTVMCQDLSRFEKLHDYRRMLCHFIRCLRKFPSKNMIFYLNLTPHRNFMVSSRPVGCLFARGIR